ncbi:hypothetical protein T03_1918 [Trichinella britovi]|uniref:Uncharacterized protein n=1 Tax=Trichinella britovi TaxID=45882 RepID=A0A0V1DE75_TRIBR|nr:hypothetical protein T03_1918 [Trichinella britovi]
MGDTKKKCRQSNIEYLKYGFIPSSGNTPECPLKTNERLPMYLISEKDYLNISEKFRKTRHKRICIIFNHFETNFMREQL